MQVRHFISTGVALLILWGCGKRDDSKTEPSGEPGAIGTGENLGAVVSSVLPRTEELNGYQKVSSDLLLDPAELSDYLGSEDETFAYYGVKKAVAADYMSVDGSLRFVIDAYLFGNSASAFGMYAHGRGPNEDFVDTGAQGYIAAGCLFFFKGNCFVRITGYIESKESDSALVYLGGVTARRIPGEPVFPAAVRILPDEHKLDHTERYYPSMLLDYDFFSPAYTCEYNLGESVATLVFIPRGSEAELIQYNQALIDRGNEVFESTDGGLKYYFCDDDIHGRVIMSVRGGRLAGVVKTPDRPQGVALLNRLWLRVNAAE